MLASTPRRGLRPIPPPRSSRRGEHAPIDRPASATKVGKPFDLSAAKPTGAPTWPLLKRHLYRQSGGLGWTQVQTISSLVYLCVAVHLTLVVCGRFPIRTIALMALTTTIGLTSINSVLSSAKDRNRTTILFLVHTTIALALIAGQWNDVLSQSEGLWTYDPARYYYDAHRLAESAFSSAALPSNNYMGVFYYYAAIFTIAGWNPVAPAIVNSLFTLMTILLLQRRIRNICTSDRYLLAFSSALLIPELIWFDAITSRETPAMFLFTCATLLWVKITPKGIGVSISSALPYLVSIGALMFVRGGLVVPAICAVVSTLVLGRKSRVSVLIAPALIVLTMVVAGTADYFSGTLGSDKTLKQLYDIGALGTRGSESVWNSDSLGLKVIPNTWWQIFLFAPVRLLIYIVAPFPAICNYVGNLPQLMPFWWQAVAASASAIVYVWRLPDAVANSVRSFKRRTPMVALHTALWLGFFGIVLATPLIHERYRVPIVPLYWAASCKLPGVTKSRGLTRLILMLGLAISTVGYFLIKAN